MSAGIPTRAFGYQFRSRLEAKWAHMFTALGWRWEYEPLDFNGWIPDFLLHMQELPTLVEIKAESSVEGLRKHIPKIEHALSADDRYEVLLLGCTPFPSGEWIPEGEPIGILDAHEQNETTMVRSYNAAAWITCRECGRIVFFDPIMLWYCRLCGTRGKVYHGPDPVGTVKALWADACNAVQWRAP